jgi:hypothetical protein
MASTSTTSASGPAATLDRYFHICAFFDSRAEEYATLGPFYEEGLKAGDKALHIVDAKLRADHRDRLASRGIDVEHCESCGQLQVLTPEDTYLANGSFDPDQMLVAVDAVIADGIENGFARTRIMGNMGWALDGAPGADRVIEYESKVNEVLSRTRQRAICVYDTARLTGAMMLDILRSHPCTLINGVIHENPFFTPPELFLRELESRKSIRASA